MNASISDPESFITSLICKLSSLTLPSTPSPIHGTLSVHPSSRYTPSNTDIPIPSPSTPQTFSTLLSTFPRDTQVSITRLLTTLHFLFPHEFIPALDLLDRALVTQLVIRSTSTTSGDPRTTGTDLHLEPEQSARPPTSDLAHDANALIIANDDDDDDSASEDNPRTDTNPETETKAATDKATVNAVFYVQSAPSQSATNPSRHRTRRQRSNNPTTTTYEVRLAAWNCTCPAFAFSAFSRALNLDPDDDDDDDSDEAQPHPDADSLGQDPASKKGEDTDLGWRFGGSLTTSTPQQSETGARIISAPAPAPVCKHILAALLGKHIPGLFGAGVRLHTISMEEAAGWAGGWGDGD